MPNWKKRTRYLHKLEYQKWLNGASFNHREGPGPRLVRKSSSRHRKKSLKRMNRGLREFAASPFYEDCRYHPCRVETLHPNEPWEGRLDIDGVSLIDGSPSSCSYEHCGILHLSEAEATERMEFMNTMGMIPYQLQYVYGFPLEETHSAIKDFVRGYAELERTWGFTARSSISDITDSGKEWFKEKFDLEYDSIELTPLESSGEIA